MTNALMNSGYARIAGDNYKTIDLRCTYAFLQHFTPTGSCVDVCAPDGSGIVDTLKERGHCAYGIADAFSDNVVAEWVISNPPYTRGLVDKIIWRQIERLVDSEVNGVAMLMRWQFDHAAFRRLMFAYNDHYLGQIKTLFRPQWFEKRPGDKQPFHSFVWHIWHRDARQYSKFPIVFYSDGERPQHEKSS